MLADGAIAVAAFWDQAPFEDAVQVPVPPGTYRLELVAFEIHPGDDVRTLDNAKAAFNRRGPSGAVQVVLRGQG